MKPPMSAVASNHSAALASGGCQNKRLKPVWLSSLVTSMAQSNPATMATNNGGK
jgi:hypothetical protein